MTNQHNEFLGNMEELYKLLEKIPFSEDIRKKLEPLMEMLIEKRSPRLMVIGRRGSGKSSIFNAIVNEQRLKTGVVDTTIECVWSTIKLEQGGEIDWLDTPGIGAGGLKLERLEEIKRCVKEKRPDLIIFAHKATEVDAEIDATLDDLASVIGLTTFEGKATAVYVVVTQVDQLPSPNNKPPYKPTKLALIEEVCFKMTEHLNRKAISVECLMPIACFFDIDGDLRYNVKEFSDLIGKNLPLKAQLEAGRAFKEAHELRKEIAEQIVNYASAAAAAIGGAPIPIADIVPLTALQVLMITAIGYLSGQKLDKQMATDFIVGLGGVVVAGTILRNLVKIIPFVGMAGGAIVAAVGTKAMGKAAIAYYLDGLSISEAKEEFDSIKNEKTESL